MPQIAQIGTDDEYLHKELTEDIVGAATGLRLALMFNFKEARLRWKRVIR